MTPKFDIDKLLITLAESDKRAAPYMEEQSERGSVARIQAEVNRAYVLWKAHELNRGTAIPDMRKAIVLQIATMVAAECISKKRPLDALASFSLMLITTVERMIEATPAERNEFMKVFNADQEVH